VNGYDSNVHEMYWSHAVPALRRGYNCLLVDGPGQGRALSKQGLHMQPNWETVMRPIVDFACTQPEIDGKRSAVMGWSFGGFLALRGVSGNQRIAALIADPGQWDQLESIHAGLPLPPELMDRLSDVDPEDLDLHLAGLAVQPLLRWRFIQRGLWVHGLKTLGQYVIDMSRYRLSDVAGSISCPTLVAWAEGDAIAAGAERLYEALGCPKTLVRFTAAEGANGHCGGWSQSRFDQQVFDWLDDSLHVTRRR
jgi:pimeloyl-ACP methyl ester carboxylesterase